MSILLELRNVFSGYGHQFRLENISLSVMEHRITGIIGPNGSGKTTLLKTISRFLKPEKGTISLDGTNIWSMNIKTFSRKVAVINQYMETACIPVFDYVMMGRIPYHKGFQLFNSDTDIEKTEMNIKIAGIDTIRDKFLDSISLGEVQMAQFAKALNQEPVLLLMDEPTSHLDIKHQVGMLDLVRKYNFKTGLTIIIVLHDLNLASEYCDELIIMKNGIIRYTGMPSEIMNYRTIEEIYETVVIVERNPLSQKPYVFLISEEQMKKN